MSDTTALYNASTHLDGFDVTVMPATLQLAPGKTQSYTVSLARTDAAHEAGRTGMG